MANRCYALRIAGYGAQDADEVGPGPGAATPSNYATSPDNRTLLYRFAAFQPTQDGEDLWLPVLEELPNELQWGVNPRTGESITSTLSFVLQPTALTRAFFLRSGWRKAANLAQAIDSSATTIYLDDSGAAQNQMVMIGQECIQLRTHNGAGEYDCYRAALGTVAAAHNVGAEYDVEVFIASHGHNLYGRLVELVVVDGDAGGLLQDQEVVLWRGVMRGALWDNTGIRLEAASVLDLVRDGKVFRNQWRGRKTGTAVGASEYVAVDPSLRFLQVETPHIEEGASTIVSDGARVFALALDEDSLDGPDKATLAPGILGYTQLLAGDTAVPEDDLPEELWEVLPIGERGGSNAGDFDDSRHPVNALPLSNDPFKLLLQLLLTTDSGGNGSWDVGPAPGLGLGLRSDLVDTTAFLRLSSVYGPQLTQARLCLGLKGEPDSLWELCQELLRPAMQTLGTRSDGTLTVVEFRDSSLLWDVNDLDNDDVPIDAPAPALNPSWLEPVAKVTVKYGARTGDQERTVTVQAPGASRWPEAYSTNVELPLGGEIDPTRARRHGLAVAARSAWPMASVDVEAMPDLSLWPGDYVRVTLADIPGVDGSGSMAAEGCMVVERAFTLEPWGARYVLLRTTAARDNRMAGIHLAARVVSYSDPNLTIAANAFVQSNHPAGWDQDSDAWADALALAGVGTIACDILDSDLSLRGTCTVASTGNNTLVLSAASTSPVANDVIVPTNYDAAEGVDEELFEFFVYMADANSALGTDNDDAYGWSF